MNNAIDRISLDVRSETSQAALSWKKGDTARVIEAALFEGNKPYSLEGCTAVFTAPKTDDMNLFNYCEIKDNRIIYKSTPGTTDTPGVIPCEFRVVGNDGEVLTSPKFEIKIVDTVIDPDKDIAPAGEATALDRLVSEASALVDEVYEKLSNGEFDGEDGKSAYEYALEGGYPYSEERFYEDLANVRNSGGGGGGVDFSDELPLMDGEASPGTGNVASRATHRHPTDKSRMQSADSMNKASALSPADAFIFNAASDASMKKISWNYIRTAIRDFLNGVIAANAIVDESTGNVATLPELGEDAVLALVSDIEKALADYYKKDETYDRTTIDGKVGDVAANAQPKGDYALRSEIPDVPVKSVNLKTGAVQLNADDVGARPNTWMPTYSEVGADKSGTAASAVGGHNVATDSHNDIRLLIEGLTARLNAIADSDDDTLDQMSEIVAYIKANKALIESITTSKVNVSDIVNNLTTNVSDKPLSAAQGVALKALINAIVVPTTLAELSGDSTHRTVTDAEKSAWNNKSDFSGAYADLSGKPTIPTVPTKVSAFENDKGYLTSFTESDPTVPSWAKASTKPKYTASEVGAAPSDKTITITGVDENGTTHTWTVYGVKV